MGEVNRVESEGARPDLNVLTPVSKHCQSYTEPYGSAVSARAMGRGGGGGATAGRGGQRNRRRHRLPLRVEEEKSSADVLTLSDTSTPVVDLHFLEAQLLLSAEAAEEKRDPRESDVHQPDASGPQVNKKHGVETSGRRGGLLRLPSSAIQSTAPPSSASHVTRTPRPGVDVPRSRRSRAESDPAIMRSIPALTPYERLSQQMRQAETVVKASLLRLSSPGLRDLPNVLVDMLTGHSKLSLDMNTLHELSEQMLDTDPTRYLQDGVIQSVCDLTVQYVNLLSRVCDGLRETGLPHGVDLEQVSAIDSLFR